MNLMFAPLEGITTYTYRNTHKEIFGGCDTYYAPFVTPVENEKISIKNLRDILPQNNKDIPLKVQILTNSAKAFFNIEKEILNLGYEEINLNFGCPSGTVVKKGRGAGALRNKEELDEQLFGIFSENTVKLSVKTRIGFYEASECEKLMEIYNKYPLENLIIHPRTRTQFYNGFPDMSAFAKCLSISKNPVCYNGNVFSKEDYTSLCRKYDNLSGVMIGRGAVRNPAIFREIKGGKKLCTEEIIEFSELLQERYYKILGCEHYTLHKLKEIWIYMVSNFPKETKILKEIKKSNSLKDLNNAISRLPKL